MMALIKINVDNHNDIDYFDGIFSFCSTYIGSWADEMDLIEEYDKIKNIKQENIIIKKKTYKNNIIDQKNYREEEKMTSIVIKCMKNDAINPFQGSIPTERIQNFIHSYYPELYNKVIKKKYNHKWINYLEAHKDVFHLFYVDNDNNNKQRIRLRSNVYWELGDKKEMENKNKMEEFFVKTLTTFLKEKTEHKCKVDEFYQYYLLILKKNQDKFIYFRKLPARGDIVRFIKKKYKHLFQYNNKEWEITLTN